MARDFQLKLNVDLATFKAGLQSGLTSLKEMAAGAFSSFKEGGSTALQNANQLASGLQNVAAQLEGVTTRARAFFQEASQAAAGDELADFRFTKVFGEAADAAGQFTETLAAGSDRAVGDIRTLLSEFGSFTQQLGFTKTESAALSEQISKTVLNFADLQNISDAQAFGVIQQALAGQTRGLKQYGIDIDEAAEKSKAFELGLNPDALTTQEAATVRLALVMERLAESSGATAEKQQTFTGATRALATSVGELFGDIGKFVNEGLKPVLVIANDVVKTIRQWIADNPTLARTLIFIGSAATGFLIVITALIGAAAGLIGTIAGLNTAIIAFGGTAQIGATAASLFGASLGAARAAALAAGPAMLVVGAAIAGWQIGKKADELLGLNSSFEKVRNGTATWGDTLKGYLFPILKAASDAAAKLGEKLEESQRASVFKLQSDTLEKLVATFKAGSNELTVYNRLLKEGVPAYQAAIIAANELNEIRFIEEKGLKASAEEMKRLQELRLRNADALKKESAAQNEVKGSTEQLTAARERLKQTEQQLGELVKTTSLEVIKARKGETAATIAELSIQLEDRRKFLRQRAADELALVTDLEQKKQLLQSKPFDSKNAAAQVALEAELQKHAANLEQIRNTMLASEEAFNANVKRVLEQRTEQQRQEAQKRVDEVRRESAAVQKEYEAELAAITAQIDRLKSARQSAADNADRFIKQKEDANLREKNASAADIKSMKEEALLALEGAKDEQTRAKIIELTVANMQKRADLSKQIADEQQRFNDSINAAAKLPEEQVANSNERRNGIQAAQNIEDLKNQEIEAKEAVFAATQDLQTKSAASAAAAAERDSDIASLEDQRLQQQERINEVRREELKIVRQIGEELQKQLAQNRPGASKRADGLMSPEETEAAALAQDGQVGVPAGKVGAETATAAAEALNANKAANATLSESLNTTAELLRGLAASGAELGKAGALLPQISTVLSAINDERIKFGELLNNFGTVVIEKFTEAKGVLEKQNATLADHTQQLKDLKLTVGVQDARAAGY